MSKLKIILIAFVVVAVSVTLLYTQAPRSPAVPPRPAEATGLVVRGYEEGNVVWETKAERGEVAPSAGQLASVVLRVFDGATTLEVSADELVQDADSVTLTGGVRARTTEGLLVSSDRMTWREEERKLESGATQLTLRGDELHADAFTYDAGVQTAALVGVTASLSLEAGLVASSDRGEISGDELRLLDNVRVSPARELGSTGDRAAPPGTNLELAADSLSVSPDGVTARGRVSVDIRFATQGEDHGA